MCEKHEMSYMQEEIITKLEEYSEKFAEHGVVLERINKKLEEHDNKFLEHDKRFDNIDRQIDFLATKTLQHDDRLERIEQNMVRRDDIAKLTRTLEEYVGLAKKKDDEMTLLSHDMIKLEGRVEVLEAMSR